MAQEQTQRVSLLDRFLGLFAKVQPGEAGLVLLMTLTVFLILCAYYVLKTTREGLILTGGMAGLRGDELKIYASGAMALLFAFIVPAYGRLANRVPRIKLFNVSYIAVLACLVVFFILGTLAVPVGLAFYIWLGLVSMFLIAQFWSYANDLYNEEQGKRLFAIIAIGGSLGAIVGPKISEIAGTFELMLIAAGLLLACLVLLNFIDRRESPQTEGTGKKEEPIGGPGGFELIRKDRYLLFIGLMLLVANLVNSTGEFLLSRALSDHAAVVVPGVESDPAISEARRELIKSFYGDFFFWVNLVGFIVQAFLVSRIIKVLGVRFALFVMPVVAFGVYGIIGVVGGLALTRAAKVAENATDYSLQNTVRQALFLPTSRAAKYKAKAAIDTFFVRFGDTMSALLVGFGLHALGLGVRELAFANVGLVVLWILIAIGIARRYGDLAKEKAAKDEAAKKGEKLDPE